MTLAEKVEQWAAAKVVVDTLEEEIKAEVAALAKSQKVATANGEVAIRYTKPRGKVDYESVAKRLGLTVSPHHQEVKVKWREVVVSQTDDSQADVIEEFTQYGSPSVTVSLKDEIPF